MGLRRILCATVVSASLLSTVHAADKPKLQKIAPINTTPSSDQQKWADKTLKRLSLEEKIGQMIQVRGIIGFYNDENPEWKQLVDDVRKYHLGSVLLTVKTDGPILLRSEPYETAMTANRLQQEAHAKVPLIFAADFERGPSMRTLAIEYFPHAMAFGATHNPQYAERFGQIVAQESRAMGIEWNYFPVADVQINPRNPIINTRSFGEDPQEVAALTSAYIRGSHSGGMLATSKHFPGHGDTDTDSHRDISRVNGSLERVNSVELPPFAADIKAGVDAVMVAHVAFPALEPDPDKVSTISKNVVTNLLRGKMGFGGVIVTDALEMKGLTKLFPPTLPNPSGRAAVAAVLAGNDMIELPSDLDGAYRGLLDAAKSGVIPRAQIDASVRRILLAKAKVGLDKGGVIDVDQLAKQVGKPDSFTFAQEVADAATTLVRDDGHVLPLPATATSSSAGDNGTYSTTPAYLNQASGGNAANLGAVNPLLAVLFVDSVHGDNGRMLEKQIRERVPNATILYVDARTAPLEAEAIANMLPQYQRVVAAVYSVPQPGQAGVTQTSVNAMSIKQTTGTVLQHILDADPNGTHTAFVAMGSPYTILDFPNMHTYLCTFSTVQTSEIAAAKALFGEMPIRGKLPVTLTNIARRGEGLERPPISGGGR